MVTTIETDLREIFAKFDQRFDRLEQRLDKIDNDLTDLKGSISDLHRQDACSTHFSCGMGILPVQIEKVRCSLCTVPRIRTYCGSSCHSSRLFWQDARTVKLPNKDQERSESSQTLNNGRNLGVGLGYLDTSIIRRFNTLGESLPREYSDGRLTFAYCPSNANLVSLQIQGISSMEGLGIGEDCID